MMAIGRISVDGIEIYAKQTAQNVAGDWWGPVVSGWDGFKGFWAGDGGKGKNVNHGL